MEMTLHLPREYVEIEEEEMMYIDGGSDYTLRKNLWGLYNKLANYASKYGAGATIGRVMKNVGLTWTAIGNIVGNYWGLAGKVISMISSVTRFLGGYAWLVGIAAGIVGFTAIWNFRIFY